MNAQTCVRGIVFLLWESAMSPRVNAFPNFNQNYIYKELSIGDMRHPDVLVNSPTTDKAYSEMPEMVSCHRCLHSHSKNQKDYIPREFEIR